MQEQDRILYISGEPFQVDCWNEQLVSLKRPNFKLRSDELKDEGEFFTTLFDTQTREIYEGWLEFGKDDHKAFRVTIPRMIFKDSFWDQPDRIADINLRSGAANWNIVVNDEKLRDRLAGKLPTIAIGNDEFIVDWRLKELRKKDHPEVRLNLKNMEMNDSGTAYLCMYDWKAEKEYAFDRHITALPQDVTALEIPYELKLDPVGVAREYGLNDVDMLEKYPIQEGLSARVIPLSETALPKLVAANQKKLQKTKPEHQTAKRKKGRGL